MMPEPARTIVFVAPRHPSASGGSTVVRNLATAFSRAGHAVEVESIYPPDSARFAAESARVVFRHEQLQRYPARIGPVPRPLLLPVVMFKRTERRRALRALRRRLDALRENDVVIFTHVLAKQVVDEAGYARATTGAPTLIGQHHASFESLVDEPWLREALPRHFGDCDAFVALTQRDAALFASLLDLRTVAIPNPASASAAEGDRASKQAVALARFSHEKQIPLMIELFAQAARSPEGQGWKLTIHGDGETREAATRAVRHLGAEHVVSLPGLTSDVDSALHGAALNMLTSSLEGFGMTILEAAQAGIPTVAFDVSAGVREQMDDGAGWLVPCQDREAYVAALRHAMSDPDERRARGDRARQRASTYDPDVIAARWEGLWAALR